MMHIHVAATHEAAHRRDANTVNEILGICVWLYQLSLKQGLLIWHKQSFSQVFAGNLLHSDGSQRPPLKKLIDFLLSPNQTRMQIMSPREASMSFREMCHERGRIPPTGVKKANGPSGQWELTGRTIVQVDEISDSLSI